MTCTDDALFFTSWTPPLSHRYVQTLKQSSNQNDNLDASHHMRHNRNLATARLAVLINIDFLLPAEHNYSDHGQVCCRCYCHYGIHGTEWSMGSEARLVDGTEWSWCPSPKEATKLGPRGIST